MPPIHPITSDEAKNPGTYEWAYEGRRYVQRVTCHVFLPRRSNATLP